jgi:hypothetical protein
MVTPKRQTSCNKGKELIAKAPWKPEKKLEFGLALPKVLA